MILKRLLQFNVILCSLGLVSLAYANNLSLGNVKLDSRNPSAKTLVVSLDLSWNNSWRNKINHDAVWVTIRLANAQDSSLGSSLCKISASGVNPLGSSVGSNSNLEVYVPADRIGAFVRRASNGPVTNVTTEGLQLTVDYSSCGFTDADEVSVSVIGSEMVFIPQGSFYAGDYNASTASLNRGSADNSPWFISSENSINVANPSASGYRYVSAGQSGEFATGATFTIPATYPKGYASFYTMKYEITEGQWVQFINSLPALARANRDVTDNNHKNSDSVITRNTVSCSGSPLVCSSNRPARAMTFLSWMDLAAYLDWAGLRPLSELEFEKTSRGPVLPVQSEYVWGDTTITAADALSPAEDGSETVTTLHANANFGNATFSGGDATTGADHQNGALRSGIFATASSTRALSGGSYYGVMELSGNVAEHIVTLGNATGLAFSATHGDGQVSMAAGYEGNGNVETWPGLDVDTSKGVTTAAGTGFRGGSWLDAATLLQISDRSQAALTSAAASSGFGGRGVRTYDGI